MNEIIEFTYVEAMLERTMGNRQLAIILFEKLFLELPEQLSVIEKAIEQQQFDLAEAVTHKLHGSFAFCGFSELEILAKDLEKSLQLNNHQQIVKFLPLLAKKIRMFDDKLQKRILMLLNDS